MKIYHYSFVNNKNNWSYFKKSQLLNILGLSSKTCANFKLGIQPGEIIYVDRRSYSYYPHLITKPLITHYVTLELSGPTNKT